MTASENYLEALFEFAQMENNYAWSRNAHHDQDVIYHHKESEHCYIEILDLKNKVDQLFLEHEISLELDLSNKIGMK